MLMNGFIKLHRKMINWEWYQDANTFRVFLHLLMKANHKDNKWQGILIKRGQLVTGRKVLAQELKLSEQAIRTALKHLQTTNDINQQATNRNSLVTIVNYDSYQTRETKQPTKQPTINQLLTTNKNVKNVKNINILVEEVKNFESSWKDFTDFRTSIKKPLTELSANMALTKLADFHQQKINPIEVINNSIESGWAGLFQPKKKAPKIASIHDLSKQNYKEGSF